MKQKFVFDKNTGTLQPQKEVEVPKVEEPVKAEEPVAAPEAPQASEGLSTEIVKMKRVDKITPVQLIDENGMPEAYLDSENMGVVMFRERIDYSIKQIVDERSNKPLMYIGGYGLAINFNMGELRSVERIEQCLQGLTKLFRKLIMDQALNKE